MDGSFVQRRAKMTFVSCICGGTGGGLHVGEAFVQSHGRANFLHCQANEGGGMACGYAALDGKIGFKGCAARGGWDLHREKCVRPALFGNPSILFSERFT